MGRVKGSAVLLVVCGLVAAGCGSSSSSSSAESKCKDAAKQISDSNARKVAEDACSAAGNAGTGITNAVSTAVKSVESSAKQACLAAAQSVPSGSARDQAVAGCNKIK